MMIFLSALVILITSKQVYSAGCSKTGTELTCTNITFATEMSIPFSSDTDSFQRLTITNCMIQSVPLGVFTRFKNLDFVDLRRNNINSIEPGAFNGLPNLKTIWMDLNNISEIKPATLNSLISLNQIDLRENSLTKIDKNYFFKLHNLKTLYLQANLIKVLSENALEGLISLETLALHNNMLTYLPIGCFKDLGNLTYLNLDNNIFKSFNFGTFTSLNKLKTLYLGSNKLTAVCEGCLLPLKELTDLRLSNNKITILNATNLLSTLPHLNTIELNKNSWTCNTLYEIILVFQKRPLVFSGNDTTKDTNILGNACKDENFDNNETESVTSNVYNKINSSSSSDNFAIYSTTTLNPFSPQDSGRYFDQFKEYFGNFSNQLMILIIISAMLLLVMLVCLVFVLYRFFTKSKFSDNLHCASIALLEK